MTQLATEHTYTDLLAMPDDGKLYELVRGQIVEKEMAALSVFVASRICFLINLYLEAAKKGWAVTELPVTCFPWLGNHGRRPDVAYFHFERHSGPSNDPVVVAPNFVVEVLSPHDDAIEVDIKIEEYLRAGVDLVWIVNPETKTVRTIQPDRAGKVFQASDRVTGGSVLPEFSALVGDFFPQHKPSNH